jgi:hypothetical protein
VRRLFQLLSALSLILTLFPAVLFFAGLADLERVKATMFAATIVWFAATPFWMGRPKHRAETGST